MHKNTLRDFLDIATNLPSERLVKVAQAILKKKVVWDGSKTSSGNEGCSGEFDFEGGRYSYDEAFENPSQLFLISGTVELVKTLIGEHETMLMEFVQKRDFETAHIINGKIQSLEKLLVEK